MSASRPPSDNRDQFHASGEAAPATAAAGVPGSAVAAETADAAEISLAEVTAAAEVLRQVVRRTPLLPAPWLEEITGRQVFLKCENLQRSGSFKVRGAYLRMTRLTAAERVHGVVAASAGNHAQGVAVAAAELGVGATVFMPRTASLPKVVATREYGAQVELVGQTVTDALQAAQDFAARTGATLIHPFDHRDVICGQATVGLEIVEQLPQVGTVLVPTGGGGLLSGIASVFAEQQPDTAVIGVQAAGAAAFAESLRRGSAWSLPDRPSTMADGIAVASPGAIPVQLAGSRVREVVSVSDEEIADAVLRTLERSKLLVEPAGVVGVAALLRHADGYPDPVVIVLSGGNVDPLVLNGIIQHGLASAGRYCAISVRMPDQPGTLAALLDHVAETGVNVVDINHVRTDPRLAVGEVEILILVQTRGPDHRDSAIAHLRTGGYEVNPTVQ